MTNSKKPDVSIIELDHSERVAQTADMVLSLAPTTGRKVGPLQIFKHGRSLGTPLASGPLMMVSVPDAGRTHMRVSFENRGMFTTERHYLAKWCVEQYGDRFEFESNILFMFHDENDALAFKLRWAGLSAEQIIESR